jgi:hypothetical protein
VLFALALAWRAPRLEDLPAAAALPEIEELTTGDGRAR